VAAAFVISAADGRAHLTASNPTVIHRFTAFEVKSIAPRVSVTAMVTGWCWTISDTVDRRYSWRCMHDNGIYDPCFSASAHSDTVVCPTRPWKQAVTEIHLTRALPTWTGTSSPLRFPWGVWTTNGKRCLSYAGDATDDVAGLRVTYGCDGGGLLLGLADQRRKTWTIHYVPGLHSTAVRQVGVTDAWT
jgi:hypothetical protein